MDVLPLELKTRIDREHIREGRLFGALPAAALSPENQAELVKRGWTLKAYEDRTVLLPPETTVEWDRVLAVFRDNLLHRAAHRLPRGLPLAPDAQAIMEEVIASTWEQREEQLRVVLSAFAFASLLPRPEGHTDRRVESFETFYFYTQAMKRAAELAVAEAAKAPEDDDEVWAMVEAVAERS
ncbi:MAG: hypothetical protein K6V97_04750 [Actinomycetia bacterium]|nr:hypothetical protein [Actinomycetes bacterium]